MTEYSAEPTLKLFHQDKISDPGSRGFTVDWQGQTITGFVVCKEGQYFAYLNSCPHTGAPLDWVDHQFLDLEEIFIQCAVHDARFEIDSGLCVSGPCIGQHLKPLPVAEVNGEIVLTIGVTQSARA